MTTSRTSHLPLLLASILAGAAALVAIGLSRFMSGPLILVVVGAALVGFVATLVVLARAAPRSPGRAVGRLALALTRGHCLRLHRAVRRHLLRPGHHREPEQRLLPTEAAF